MTPDDLKEVIRLHGLWLRKDPAGIRANLSGADLSGADLRGADLRGAYLTRADLSDAYLSGADLSGAYLTRANLSSADLIGADLIGANLSSAPLSGANLIGADLSGANLSSADLSGAPLSGANLSSADLSGAIGNMLQVKSAQFDLWQLVWTRARDGVTTLRIGCQSHDLEMWRKSDPRWISTMDVNATDWWTQYRSLVLALVDASPAVMWGAEA